MLCSKDKRNEGNPLIFNPTTGNLLQNLLHDNLDIDDLNSADEIADEYLLMAIKCQSDCNSTNDIKNSISRFLKASKNTNSLFKSTNSVRFWKTILTVHWLLIDPKLDSRKQIFKMATKAMGLTWINLMAGLTVQNRKFLCISAGDSSGVEEIWSNWFAPWNFEVEHIKRNHNLLIDFLSKSQGTISAMSPIIHVLEPIDLPQHLQEEILQLTLTKRSLENVRELQKLYIHSFRKVISERNGIKISKEYCCEVHYGCEQIDKESEAFHHDRTIMCFANHVDPANVPKELFYIDTSKWYNTDVCPKDYIKEICKCIISFVEQYSWDFEDFDHPIYQVHLRSYPKPKKYVPGLKIYIDNTSDDETDDD
ncbi:Uncharacterized protein Fot_11614 [Forsythia ovata]|uniref:Uncharacterized protein n=1 Tax=Forsythia ovata TaxID=205694 RepID=A0ABD1WK73_9LAMI